MRLLFLALLLFSIVPAAGWAQRYEELAARYSRPHVYHEAFTIPAGERAALVVSFRIPNRMLVFLRNRQETPGRAFLAEPLVTVQVFRGKERVAEQAWQQTHHAASFEETQQADRDVQGIVRFDVPPGDYTYRLRLKDGQADREGTSDPRPVSVPDLATLHLGRALPARALYAGPAYVRVDLANLGGDVPYGEDAWAVLPIILPDALRAADASLGYTLRRVVDPQAGASSGTVVAEGAVGGAAWVALGGAAEVLPGEGALRWPVAAPSGAATGYLASVNLGGKTLQDGTYVLEATLTAGAASTTAASRLRTYWRHMPYSLYASEVAIRNLRFVTDKETMKALRQGSRKEQEAKILAYWKRRDPTPETPFNELMAEYYRRVDHAAFAFRTGLTPEPDGLQTDRAPVYIVHGPPAKIERTFPPGGGVEETWTYADGRRFVFWGATSLDPPQLRQSTTQ